MSASGQGSGTVMVHVIVPVSPEADDGRHTVSATRSQVWCALTVSGFRPCCQEAAAFGTCFGR